MLTLRRRIGAAVCSVTFTERGDQDHEAGLESGDQDREAGLGSGDSTVARATWLRQVHGKRTLRVTEPGEKCGEPADSVWTTEAGVVLQVHTADCVPIALYGQNLVGPAIAAIHAGWKGLLSGVVASTADAMRSAGATGLRAIIGPYIHAADYEFGQADLTLLTQRYGCAVATRTRQGTPALDLGAATAAALCESAVSLDHDVSRCTATDADRYFSHRARSEIERMVMSVRFGTWVN